MYIGRPGPWGTPFVVGRDGKQGECVILFATWFDTSDNPRAVWMREHVHELHGKTIGCWCKVKNDPTRPCHGDVLAERAAEYAKKRCLI